MTEEESLWFPDENITLEDWRGNVKATIPPHMTDIYILRRYDPVTQQYYTIPEAFTNRDAAIAYAKDYNELSHRSLNINFDIGTNTVFDSGYCVYILNGQTVAKHPNVWTINVEPDRSIDDANCIEKYGYVIVDRARLHNENA